MKSALDEHLGGRGAWWADVPRRPALAAEVALLDQAYQNLTTDAAVWPPPEVEPFSYPDDPAAESRAAARGRFLTGHAGDPALVMNWGAVYRQDGTVSSLADPFSGEYGPCIPATEVPDPPR